MCPHQGRHHAPAARATRRRHPEQRAAHCGDSHEYLRFAAIWPFMSTTREDVTFGLALLGSVLGLINIWRQFDRDRVKLRVTPKVAYPINMPDERPRLCIDVINLSTVPV